MRVSLLSILALSAVACIGSQAQYLARPEPIEAAGSYQHVPSGRTFPAAVGSFRRVKIMRFDRDGRDVSVGYNSDDRQHPVVATVYVYPVPEVTVVPPTPESESERRAGLAAQAFEQPKRDVLTAHSGGRVVEEREVTLKIGDRTSAGRMAAFDLEQQIGDGPLVPVRSYLFVYFDYRPGWILKFRITHPRALGGRDEVRHFMEALAGAVR